MNKFLKKTNGFTLLEVLVSVLLLSVTVVALLTLVSDSITSATYGKNDITATYIGQEALDYFRNFRDTQLHQGSTTKTWNDFLRGVDGSFINEFGDPATGTDCYSSNGCELDIFGLNSWNSEPFVRGCLVQCTEVKKANSSLLGGVSYYTISRSTSGKPTGFTRTIRLKQPSGVSFNGGSDVVLVEVTVRWYNGNSVRSKVFTETLYNWTL